MKQLIVNLMRRGVRYISDKAGVRVEIRRRRPNKWNGLDDRISYQEQYVEFNIKPGDQVLDIGNGGFPFPYATVLADRFQDESPSRYEGLITNNKPFVLTNIEELGFRDKVFDFVYCSHILEVIENPVQACAEIMRIGKRGFIETPTLGKDTLFAWAKNIQKWHVMAIGGNLCFFEYSERQLEGIKSSAWRDLILSEWQSPLQEAFEKNQDVFNVMFTWEDHFAVFVFRLDGSVEVLNVPIDGCRMFGSKHRNRNLFHRDQR